MAVTVRAGRIDGLFLVDSSLHVDDRGFFTELWHADRFSAAGLTFPVAQANLSGSRQGVLRGLHYQVTRPQGKLVRALSGRIFDVAVDLRPDSPTFRQWEGYWLDNEARTALYLPPGLAHGFYVESAHAEVLYLVTDVQDPAGERVLRWDSAGIEWPFSGTPVLSARDAAAPGWESLAC